jgi:hypothetical protein
VREKNCTPLYKALKHREHHKINWSQELLLALFYKLKDADQALVVQNYDIAMKEVNLEMNMR